MSRKPKTAVAKSGDESKTATVSSDASTSISNDTNSGGGPTAAGNASAANAGGVGGVPTSTPEAQGTASGTNTSGAQGASSQPAGAGIPAGPVQAADLNILDANVGDLSASSVQIIGVDQGAVDDQSVTTVLNVRDRLLRVTHMNQLANFAELVDPSRHMRVVWLFNSNKFTDENPPAAIKIECSIEGFRRGGMRHAQAAVEYALDHFHPDQLEAMLAEPALTVELV